MSLQTPNRQQRSLLNGARFSSGKSPAHGEYLPPSPSRPWGEANHSNSVERNKVLVFPVKLFGRGGLGSCTVACPPSEALSWIISG
jgi:hypothetical protein